MSKVFRGSKNLVVTGSVDEGLESSWPWTNVLQKIGKCDLVDNLMSSQVHHSQISQYLKFQEILKFVTCWLVTSLGDFSQPPTEKQCLILLVMYSWVV